MTNTTRTAYCIGRKPFGILAEPCRQCQSYSAFLGGCEEEQLSFPPEFVKHTCPLRVAPVGKDIWMQKQELEKQ